MQEIQHSQKLTKPERRSKNQDASADEDENSAIADQPKNHL